MAVDDQNGDLSAEHRPFLTRRRVLHNAGLAIAAAAFPAKAGMATPLVAGQRQEQEEDPSAELPPSDVMVRLSDYLSQARDRAMPDNVVEKTKWHVLDTFTAMVSGSELPAGRAAIKFANAYAGMSGGGKGSSTIVGDTVLCSPIEAALTNGVLAHSDETDDSWPSGWHPGCIIVPSSLAVGEAFGISGAHFLRAVALGYDIGSRVIILLSPLPEDRHQSSHATCGVFGAAAAAGCAASLTAQQMRWALSYTVEQRAGTRLCYRDVDHTSKGFTFAGLPARSGVTAALVVHAGWTAVEDMLTGPDNFLQANKPKANPELLVEKLGERYEIVPTTIKRWPAGSPNQVSLDAMEALLKRQPIDAERVQQVIVRSGISTPMPDINISYLMSLMLIDKAATFRTIHDKARMLKDPAILRLRAKVRLEGGGSRTGGGPPILEVLLTDGTRLTQAGKPVLGTKENPITRDQVIAKARDLMSPVLGAAQTTRLIDTVLALDKTKDIRELRPLLQRTAQAGPPKLSDYPMAK